MHRCGACRNCARGDPETPKRPASARCGRSAEVVLAAAAFGSRRDGTGSSTPIVVPRVGKVTVPACASRPVVARSDYWGGTRACSALSSGSTIMSCPGIFPPSPVGVCARVGWLVSCAPRPARGRRCVWRDSKLWGRGSARPVKQSVYCGPGVDVPRLIGRAARGAGRSRGWDAGGEGSAASGGGAEQLFDDYLLAGVGDELGWSRRR